MEPAPDDYSRRLRSHAAADEYDRAVYGRHSVSDLLWRVEKRGRVLSALCDHLAPDGLLLVNIHANPLSYRGLMIPYHWLKEKLTGRKMLQHLSRRRTAREIRDAGLEIVDIIGLGFVSGRLLRWIPFRFALAVEQSLAGRPGLQFFGFNQLFVCRRR